MDRIWAAVLALFAAAGAGPAVDHEALRTEAAAAWAYASLLSEPAPPPKPTPNGKAPAKAVPVKPAKSALVSPSPAPVTPSPDPSKFHQVQRWVCRNGVCKLEWVWEPIRPAQQQYTWPRLWRFR